MIPSELIESLRRGNAVLYIGSGLSVGAGLPSWSSLIKPLAIATGSHWPTDDRDLVSQHLLDAAQRYENSRGRNALVRHLRDALDTNGVQPTPVHGALSSLGIRHIFTTNYDDLIERALDCEGRRIGVVVQGVDLAYTDDERVQVVKLCGDLKFPDSIVITKYDFNVYQETHRLLFEHLQATLLTRTPLFLGYGLSDPFFNNIWDRISLQQGQHRRMGYAVMFDAQQDVVDDLRRRNITVLSVNPSKSDRTAALLSWVQNLLTAMALDDVNVTLRPPGTAVGFGEQLHRIESKLDQSMALELERAERMLAAMQESRMQQTQLAQSVEEIREWASGVQDSVVDPILKGKLQQLSGHSGSAYQYLQLALPIIPGILSYNIELGTQHETDLRAIWQRVRARLFSADAASPSAFRQT